VIQNEKKGQFYTDGLIYIVLKSYYYRLNHSIVLILTLTTSF